MGLRLRNRDWEIEELNVAFLNREGDEARSPESSTSDKLLQAVLKNCRNLSQISEVIPEKSVNSRKWQDQLATQ